MSGIQYEIGVKRLIKRINNITLAVSDLKETTSFYENTLGLKKTGEWSNYVIFDVGGLELAFEAGGKKERKEGAPDIFMLVDDVDEAYKKLRDKGVKFATEQRPILGRPNSGFSRSRREHVHSGAF